ncbi:transporter [Streptomyces fuscigenes]|nr:transporter [Streptomyces fuscigenes]
MSLGLAVAMGAPLGAALLSAGIGGIVAGSLGGSPLLVSGPSAGLTVVTAGMIQQFGWQTTCAITIGAGLLQILLGTFRAARSALAVSPAVVHGTLAGIGVAIALAQLHVVLGGSPQSSALANITALPGQLARVGPASPLVGALTLAVLIVWPRLPGRVMRRAGRVPAALVSVGVATAVAAFAAPGIARVELPSWGAHVLPGLPSGPLLPLLAAVLTMTLVASLESLLSAVAVDKLAGARAAAGARSHGAGPSATSAAPRTGRPDLDRELRAQGVANALSGALGGLAVSGGAVRGSANVRAGATSRASTVLHGVWVLLAAGLLVSTLERIPLAALAALVMTVGVQMVSYAHIRNVHRHREFPVYVATVASVILLGVLQGVAIGGAVAVVVALRRLTRTHITTRTLGATYHVCVRGQLTFLAVPRLTRALHQVPQHAECVVELDASFMDHAAYEVLHEWRSAHVAHGGGVEFTGRAGGRFADPVREPSSCCRPWTSWRNHHCGEAAASRAAGDRHSPAGPDAKPEAARRSGLRGRIRSRTRAQKLPQGQGQWQGQEQGQGRAQADARAEGQTAAGAEGRAGARVPAGRPGPAGDGTGSVPGGSRLAGGLSAFQRNTAPLVRDELARLAREGQRPSQLFLTCSDSRLVTSMITASGPGDLFTVRNVGNLVPLPDAEGGDESVAAAIEYAVDVLRVESITVCGHSGCGAMQALLQDDADARTGTSAGTGTNAEADTDGKTRTAARADTDADRDSTDAPAPSAATAAPAAPAVTGPTPLRRWLRHGRSSLRRIRAGQGPRVRLSARPVADEVEELCLTNVVQQLDNLRAHASVARRLAEGTLALHGMYFHVGEAQAYLLGDHGQGPEPELPYEPPHEDRTASGTASRSTAATTPGSGAGTHPGAETASRTEPGAGSGGLPAAADTAEAAVFHRVAASEPVEPHV